ncbi:MAG: ABC transporter ATP-binding protein [Actinobacteria bacterium]|nr:ABC transporter ATP-binding protein [Actinomycetota bacterium]
MFRTSTPVVEVRSIWRRFKSRTILRDVSFDTAPGEIHALIGPNGVGKTTLLRTIAGLIEPSRGTVSILGGSPRSAWVRERIGWVPSGDRSLYLRISGYENLVFFARLHGMNRRDATRRAGELMREVGLDDAMHIRSGLYSHGMQKRVAIARALLTDPQLLLFDEPTHELDPSGAAKIHQVAKDAAGRGAGVIWATHRLDELPGLADTVTVLGTTGVRFQGSVDQLMALANERSYVIRLGEHTSSADDLEQMIASFGTLVPLEGAAREEYLLRLRNGTVLGDVIGSLASAGLPVLACREARPEIEEAFLTLTAESTDDLS